MIKIKYQVFFTAVLAAAAGLSGAEITPSMQETISRVDLGRQEVSEKADLLVRQANQLASEGAYMKAAERYRAAIRELNKFNSPVFNARIEFCRKQIADCYFRQAQEAMRQADKLAEANEIDEAIKLCKEAIKYCPEQIEALESCIKRYEGYYEKAIETAKVSPERLLPNQQNQEYQIQVLLEQGRKLAAAGEYGLAKRKFDEVLLINPYNSDALQNLQAVNSRIGKIGKMRYGQMHRRTMAEVEWKYAIPVLPEGESSAAKNIISGTVRTKSGEGESALHKKLEGLIIPRISLNEVTLGAAIKYLRDQSRQLDPNQRGVNIILHNNFGNAGLLKKAQTQDAANADGENPPPEEGAEGGEGAAAGNQAQANAPVNQQPPLEETLINLDIRNRSMLRAIQELCKVAKLAYRIDEYAVVISRPEEMSNEMRTRLYPINITDQNTDSIKQNLIASGIKFPPGSSIFYDNRISRLVATNTVENLRKIESVIHELYDDQDPMIQLQLKFLEISQNDLNELAFNWQLSVNANQSYKTGKGDMSSATIMQRNSNDLLRYYVGDGSTAEQRNPLSDASLNYIWENSDGTRIQASMFALNWADSGDVLASPRITTISGQQASVQMTETHYYPESWETIDVETVEGTITSGWVMTGADPQPELENEQELGVSFVVKPEIHDKVRRLIRVPISFPIKSFNSWMIFDARTYDSDGSVDGEYYKMPVLNERRLSTEALIYDGETIVLGGIAQDNSTVVNDKIPILGDLPFIGRLFRSKYVDSKKSNLLIFMTCRLVKPDGTAFYPDEVVDRGVPRFQQL